MVSVNPMQATFPEWSLVYTASDEVDEVSDRDCVSYFDGSFFLSEQLSLV